MDYLVTTGDGSKHLMHHGIKGMKWGKWNAETAARYAGSHGGKMPSVAKARAKYGAKEVLATTAQIGGSTALGVGTALATGNPVAGGLVGSGSYGASIGGSIQKENKWKQDLHKETAAGYRYKAYKATDKAKQKKYNVKAEEQEAKYRHEAAQNTAIMDAQAKALRDKASKSSGKKAERLNSKATKFEKMSQKYKDEITSKGEDLVNPIIENSLKPKNKE